MLISDTYVASSGNCARHSASRAETPRSNKRSTLGAYSVSNFSAMESPKTRRDASNQTLNLCTASSTADSKKKKSFVAFVAFVAR